MDKLNDIFKEIKQRLTSPLLFSFLLSWLIINWRVTIGLVLYKIEDLQKDKYESYADLIVKNYSPWHYYIYPFIISVIYTFGFPFIRSGIKLFQSWLNRETDNRLFKISGTTTVPMDRFIKDRELYLSNTIKLKEIMDKESEYLNESQTLRAERNQLQEQLNEYSTLSHNNFLNGYWDIKHIVDGQEKTERVNVSQGRFYKPGRENRDQEWLSFENYGINPGNRNLIILFTQKNGNPAFTCVFRYLNEDKLILRSYEEGTKIIQMDKYVKPKTEPEAH